MACHLCSQAIVWTNDWSLLIGSLGTKFSDIWIKMQFQYRKTNLKMLSTKWIWKCLGLNVLTQWGLNKMVDILQTFSNAFCCMKSFSFKFHLKFVPEVPIDNKLALILVMAWGRTGDKPLPLNQWWPISMTPYIVTRQQNVMVWYGMSFESL